MLIALAAMFFMPQSPGSWKYLTPRQQYIAAERMQREHDSVCMARLSIRRPPLTPFPAPQGGRHLAPRPRVHLQRAHAGLRLELLLHQQRRPGHGCLCADHPVRVRLDQYQGAAVLRAALRPGLLPDHRPRLLQRPCQPPRHLHAVCPVLQHHRLRHPALRRKRARQVRRRLPQRHWRLCCQLRFPELGRQQYVRGAADRQTCPEQKS